MNNKGSRNAMQKSRECEDGGDRFSRLPNDILLNILERLDTLDSLRTCILSKQMLQLPTMLSRFDMDIGSLIRHHDTATHRYTLRHAIRYNHSLAAITERILFARNAAIHVRELRAICYLRPYECLPITRAFARTMATHKVDHAELVLLVEKPYTECTHDHLLRFAKRFNTCLGHCPAAFAGLTHLWLCNMRFGERDIPNILSTCKRLEHLRLSFCDAGLRSVLLVEHDQLVVLHIEHGKFGEVHLNCVPKLQHLICIGWCYSDPPPLAFGYLPQLSKLSLIETGIRSTKNLQLSQLLSNVTSISDLHLDFQSEKIWVVPECAELLAPVFGKLGTVHLNNLPEGCDIAWTSFILEAAPCLRDLCITVWDHWCEMVTDQEFRRKHGYCEKANVEWQPSASDFVHKSLLKLTIHGFQSDENMVRYVRHIMEVAVNMGEISLHNRKVCERCWNLDPRIKVSPSTYPTSSEEKDRLRVEMTKELGIVASPSVIHFRS